MWPVFDRANGYPRALRLPASEFPISTNVSPTRETPIMILLQGLGDDQACTVRSASVSQTRVLAAAPPCRAVKCKPRVNVF
jgi:hypothetical protein